MRYEGMRKTAHVSSWYLSISIKRSIDIGEVHRIQKRIQTHPSLVPFLPRIYVGNEPDPLVGSVYDEASDFRKFLPVRNQKGRYGQLFGQGHGLFGL